MSRAAILSAGFDLHVPAEVRRAAGWKPGQRFAFVPKGEGMVIVPVPELDDLQGIAAGKEIEGYRERDDGRR